jgi:hypothetical protein
MSEAGAVIVHDASGQIMQVIIQVECTLDVLFERWQAAGMKCIRHHGQLSPDAMFNSYISNGMLTPKPPLQFVGEVRPIKADGQDALSFTVAPAGASVSVFFEESLVHQEQIGDTLEFSADHAGTYRVIVTPPFPYRAQDFTIEVTA